MHLFIRIVDSINERVGRYTAYLAAVMMILISYEVFMRYAVGRPPLWGLELNSTLLCIYGALSGGYALMRGGHVNVEIVSEHFGVKTRAIVNICTSFLFFGFILILLKYSWEMAVESVVIDERFESSITNFPLYPSKIGIVVGVILILVQGVANLLREVKTIVTGVEPSKPAGVFERKSEN
jgi:TRAP-type mannitol/chloroaromatic compound transport system permease small subunit